MTRHFPDPRQSITAPVEHHGMDRRIDRQQPLWRSSRKLVIVALLAIGAVFLWHFLPVGGSTDIAAADIETGTVERRTFDDYLPVRATVAPAVTTLVAVLSGGRVEKLLVQDGAVVSADQPLSLLANPELKLDILTREAQIASQLGAVASEDLALARYNLDRAAEIAQANYDLIKARRQLSIRQELYDKGIVTDAGVRSYVEEEAYQRKRLAQLRAGQATEARIKATQIALLSDTRKRLTSSLDAVGAGLQGLQIRAPSAGRLTNFLIQPGQTLKPGDPAGQIDDERSWKLTADVDEYYLGRVVAGQKAMSGSLRMTVSKVLAAVKDGKFRIELAFYQQPRLGLSRGQTLDTRITLSAAASAVLAPIGAWVSAGGGTTAFVLDQNGEHARRRPIKVGRRNSEYVEILSGLRPGDRIVTSDLSTIKGNILNIG